MNKRQIDLLKNLLLEKEYRPLNYFSKMFKVSVKTLSNDLDTIEEEILSPDVQIDRKQGQGIKLMAAPSQREELTILLNRIKVHDEDLSLEQRRIQILFNLLINTDRPVSIQKLSDKYWVSRTSIINDMNAIEKILEKNHLSLEKTSKGTTIAGSEINIRKALVALVQEYGKTNPSYIEKYQRFRRREMAIREMNAMFNEETVRFFDELLRELENKIKLVIYEPYYTNLLTHLIIMTNRILSGNHLDENNDLGDQVLVFDKGIYRCAMYMVEQIESKFSIRIQINEIVYIYKYLTSIGLKFTEEKDEKTDGDQLPVRFTKYMAKIVSELTGKDYYLSRDLLERLLLHVKPMLNRVKYNIQIKNPLLEDFLTEFPEPFLMIKIACHLACQKYGLNRISDHDVAYLLSYFVSEDEKAKDKLKVKTVVICHSGYGTSQLLATRLEKDFPQLEVTGVIASNSIKGSKLEEMDLIISTVDLNLELPYLLVSAFLSDMDKTNIKSRMEQILSQKLESISEREMDVALPGAIQIEKSELDRIAEDKRLMKMSKQVYVGMLQGEVDKLVRYQTGSPPVDHYIVIYSSPRFLSAVIRKLINEMREAKLHGY